MGVLSEKKTLENQVDRMQLEMQRMQAENACMGKLLSHMRPSGCLSPQHLSILAIMPTLVEADL